MAGYILIRARKALGHFHRIVYILQLIDERADNGLRLERYRLLLVQVVIYLLQPWDELYLHVRDYLLGEDEISQWPSCKDGLARTASSSLS